MQTTESESLYDHLEQKSVAELLFEINTEDQKVALAVQQSLPQIEALVTAILPKMQQGGRLFYIGAGTSGRLGILDASECPPTYGVSEDMVVGIIAGGDHAIKHAVENAEDNPNQAWADIESYLPNSSDSIIGLAASGNTPYVIGGLIKANENGLTTACIVCNTSSAVAQVAKYPVEVIVGPEYVTGSTRMKSGTAQKLVINMISTSLMIKLGRVMGNKMVDMQLSNEKLVQRAVEMIIKMTTLNKKQAEESLKKWGSVRLVMQNQ